MPAISRLLWLTNHPGAGRLRIIFLVVLGASMFLMGCVATDRPNWDASPVASAECELIVSKDQGQIKYCRRGDYAEIFRLDANPVETD